MRHSAERPGKPDMRRINKGNGIFKGKVLWLLLLMALVFGTLPAEASAIGNAPPAVTVVVYGAPKDLRMHVVLQYEGNPLSSPLEYERRGWESLYRFYRLGVSMHGNAWSGNARDFRGAVLLLESSDGTREIPIAEGLLTPGGNSDVLTLYYRSGELSAGFAPWRAPVLIAMRVAAALLIEGVFFYFSGFSTRKSWVLFVVINVVIHGFLNWLCCGKINYTGSRYAVGFFTAVLVAFITELVAFVLTVEEYNTDKLARCLIRANLVSHAVNYVLMAVLPL